MDPIDARFFRRKRYYMIAYLMLGWAVSILLRTNLSICIVSMTSGKNTTLNNVTITQEAEFHWTSFQTGIILSSFSWGYILSWPAGILATKFGGVRMFGLGVLVTGILTVLSPFLLRQHFSVYLVGRFLEGVFEGISSASQGEIFIQWIPPDERTILINVVFIGYPFGYIISYPIAGYLTYIFEWRSTFHITGAMSIVWSLIWLFIFGESPIKDKFIGKTEKHYFKSLNMTRMEEKVKHPWRKIVASIPVWAYLNARFVEAWSASFMGYCMPMYIKDVHDTDINMIGWISSAPYYFEIIGKIPAVFLADYLMRNKIWTKTKFHKTSVLCAQIGAIISLVVAGMTTNFSIIIGALAFFNLCFAPAYASYNVLPVEMSGRHSSLIYGVINLASGIGSILNPLVIGLIVKNHTYAEWSYYFLLLCLLNAWATIIFAYKGSADLQPWATNDKNVPEDNRILEKCSVPNS